MLVVGDRSYDTRFPGLAPALPVGHTMGHWIRPFVLFLWRLICGSVGGLHPGGSKRSPICGTLGLSLRVGGPFVVEARPR